ncbi:BTAD domain-containing putative transcriptional regulator [Pseudonocardia sp.]|uniref:BTAD domain-containing putative transcriptional regulator n=1 Tax=Pseudonocardia sp. TaxID=60912 RepID=UPI0034557D53
MSPVALEYGLLGPVHISHDGRELDLGTPQQCAVLGLLLLAKGRPLSLEHLVDGLWGDSAPAAAAATVRTYLSRLRRVLPSARPGSSITSVRGGYLLSIEPASLDLTLFDQRVRRAREARDAGDPLQAVTELRTGLALWRGEALGGARGEYVRAERDRLQARRLLALQDRIALDIELARHAEVLPELATLTRLHPLEERWRQLHMLALYRSGRQADALQVYRDVHALLVSELGIEPGRELRELHSRILIADPDLDSPTPPPAQRLSLPPHTAPEDADDAPGTTSPGRGPTPVQRLLAGRLWAARQHSFVGRGAERALFASALRGTGQGFAALYLHGPAGIGKSTLLRQLADDATAAHRRVVPVCGRVVGASVAAFTDAASPALSDPRAVLMIDAFEWCGDLQGWLRERFLPQLPDGVVVALAGRQPPEPAWRFDPSWSGALLVHGLGDLSVPEADQLLESRGMPDGVRESVLAFAGGHPLALSLGAEVARRCVSAAGRGRPGDEVLQTLLTEVIETAPSPDHRMALHLCAHSDTTSEQLLRAVKPGQRHRPRQPGRALRLALKERSLPLHASDQVTD